MNVIIHIKEGKITNIKAVSNFFRELKDGKYILEAKSYSKRSLNQNNYYWLMMTEYILPGLRNLGWEHIRTKDDASDYCKKRFLTVSEVNKNTGEMIDRIRGTSELSKAETSEYWERIWQFASEDLGIYIPPPNTDISIEFTDDFTNQPGKL